MRWWTCLAAFVMGSVAPAARGAIYTPESPEVQAAMAKAIAFLSTDAANDTRIGAKSIAGLALLKNNVPLGHARISEAVKAIRQGFNDGSFRTGSDSMYNLGMAIIFLVNADRGKYRSDIQKLLDIQGQMQKQNGAWGYEHSEAGDTSMTQYGVLSMWEAAEAGFDVPVDRWERAANWLLRTQDPGGAFGYQAIDPGLGNFVLTPQADTRLSMCAAGAGSLYICSDRFGMVSLGKKSSDENDEELPDALRPVGGKEKRTARPGTKNVDRDMMEAARDRADNHFDRNFKVQVPSWNYYYLYSVERYQSFREAAAGRIGYNADWYDDGVKYLLSKQNENGGWDEQCGPMADTAFSVLFMVRSTRKSITRARYFGGGTLVGGRGLPHGEGSAFVRSGRIKRQALAGPADELFAAMNDPDNEQYFRALEDLEELSFEGDAELLNSVADRLKDLAADGPPEARVAAVRSLARTRKLDHAPTLILALEDPDAEVFREAVAGLRFMSRRLNAERIPTEPTDVERRAEIRAWQSWYVAIRPGATFEPPLAQK